MALTLGHLCAPITALHFEGDLLLAGEGCNILVYDIRKRKFLQEKQVFVGASVHGITKGPVHADSQLLCYYGSKQACIVKLSSSQESECLDILKSHEFNDWIWQVKWISRLGYQEGCIAVCLAHNCVSCWDWSSNTVIEEIHCEDKCILYSACLLGENWETLVVAAGTVFCQVEFWACQGEQNNDGRVKVMHQLKGHQGVIFSIAVHETDLRLCSVSDDRSIRLYSLTVPDQSVTSISSLSLCDWQSVQFSLQHVLYGHTARVWDVRLLDNCFVSIGEDSMCCVWNYEGKVVKKFKGHKGKSIWSLAAKRDGTLLATGGGDCSIRLWEMSTQDLHTSGHLVNTLQLPQDESPADFPRTVEFLDPNCILVMTNNGCLFQYHVHGETWNMLMNDHEFRSYSVLVTSKGQEVIVVGNIHGCVRLFYQGRHYDFRLYDSKVFSIVCLSQSHDDSLHLVTTGPDGKLSLCQVSLGPPGVNLSVAHTLDLPYNKQRWVSAACLLEDDGLLVCGDRAGSVHVYQLQEKQTELTQSFWKLHGKSGVTDVCYHGDRLYTCGRDGQYRQYTVQDGTVHLLNSTKVLKGFDWISRMVFDNGELFVLGFHTDNFIMYSVDTNQKLVSIPCGGGHRAWDFCYHDNAGYLVYIKSGDVVFVKADLQRCQARIKDGLHGKEITCVEYLQSLNVNNDVYHVCVTGSEDTHLNIVTYRQRSDVPSLEGEKRYTALKKVNTLQGHISSVRALTSITTQRELLSSSFLVFSGGGRAQIKCWRVHIKNKYQNNARITNIHTEASLSDCDSNIGGDFNIQENFKSSHIFSCDNLDKTDGPNVCHSGTKATDSEKLAENIQNFSESYKDFISDSRKDELKLKTLQSDDLKEFDINYELVSTYMLHSTQTNKSWRKRKLKVDPETRVMALTCVRGQEVNKKLPPHTFIIGAACSDAFVRFFEFNEEKQSFSLVYESDSHDHCVLVISHMTYVNQSLGKSSVVMVTGGTDGCLLFWDVSAICEEKVAMKSQTDSFIIHTVKQCHQSGINCVNILNINSRDYLIATGGDDNSICVHHIILDVKDRMEITNRCKWRATRAHSTQITGVHFIDSNLLLSCSIDQRLCLWKLDPESQNEGHSAKMNLVSCRYTNLSDAHGMDVWFYRDDIHILIGGVGLQLASLKSKTLNFRN